MSTVHFRVDRTRSHNTRHRIFAILAGVLLAITATLGPAAAASASDWGGYADPASCSGNDLVKEVNVYSNSSTQTAARETTRDSRAQSVQLKQSR